MDKLLLLGGSSQQVPAIEYANSKGYYTILCDYLPDNPGQYHAHKYYCVSTTDKEAILNIATKEKVNGVVAYASDPAAPTAAYVSEKLQLDSNSYKSVNILAYKDKFRKFLKMNDFHTPEAKSYTSFYEAEKEINRFLFPVMVKPIDSSGSKGVSKIEKKEYLEKAYKLAEKNSREKRVIIEEFIEMDHPFMIAGDCFVTEGHVEYWGLLNSHRNKMLNPYVPIGTSYPLYLDKSRIEKVKVETQRLFNLLDIKFGAFNLEIMIDRFERLFFIEVGPRNGGNMIPDLLFMATGEDMIAATIDSAIGNIFTFRKTPYLRKYISTYVLHSEHKGILEEIVFQNGIEEKIIKKIYYKNIGDDIEQFDGANKALGIIFIEFCTQSEQIDFYNDPKRWIKVKVLSKSNIVI